VSRSPAVPMPAALGAQPVYAILCPASGCASDPAAAILDAPLLQSSSGSGGHRAGYDSAKRRKGSKAHVDVNALGHLLAALGVTLATEHQTGGRWTRS